MTDPTQTEDRVKIVIVDDHEMVAEGLRNALSEDSAFEVVAMAGTVKEAVAAAEQHRPDVMLMDFGLPDGNGAEATSLVKKISPETKVVIVTSMVDDDILLLAIEAGCSGYITKQKPLSEVVQAVRVVSAGEALISPTMMARLLPRLRHTERGLGSDLTTRESEILGLLAEGHSNKAISEKLKITLKTVRNHVQNILQKLDAHSKLEAVATAVREGLIRFPD